MDAGQHLRRPARAARAVQPGLPHVLARPGPARPHHAHDAAQGRRPAGRARQDASPPAGGLRPRRARGVEARAAARAGNRDRRLPQLLLARAAAADGFRVDDRRRQAADPRGPRIDRRASLKAGIAAYGDAIPLRRAAPRSVPPPLVVLVDISGSMSRYARMFLHFVHALANDPNRSRGRVSVLLFGTRLTSITRELRQRDVDVALDRVSARVRDWAGGTRIGACLHDFNRLWSRRLLGQNACVLLLSDGLDREGGEGLAAEMERLHKSCRQLIWLNPLLRYDGFEARAAGIVAMRPHVDLFLPAHNLDSLADLGRVLAAPRAARRDEPRAA
ncbi:MAG: VWA domain-containing protein [Rhodocyclaceae bacterium]|nr:VWA domain-containing protein [Rhodocyclaceae bacterium]